ncbi:FimB/Mfa2 family fimbrial subunit [Dysgonomonas mossii]|uniref:FimB/Mfa2 family fimbrial subunit n=1 Tax=Dysgonomonas mossii TaxID=163665 RepID=UPI003994E69E
MKLKIRYILLACLAVSFWACDSMIYDDHEKTQVPDKAGQVYLSVTRAQAADTETINEDDTDYEDRVHDLALLVFDSSTGEKVCEYFDEGISFAEKEKTFTIKLTTGIRDFYFVANMPMTLLKTISSKSAMDTYMATFRDLDTGLYLEATESKGFPMSRVYLNQTVSEGGNIYQPKPFRPVVNGTEENRIKLIRAVAKLEVVIEGAALGSGVKNIYYKNAYHRFGLTADLYPVAVDYYEDKLLKKVGNSYLYYMPEAMMMNTNPLWSVTGHKPINYFLIETLDGTSYQIPIITDDRTITDTDYLAFATGQNMDKPDYNIYRNRHYYYVIKKLQTIEIIYTIDPWIVKKSATYMGYGYNVNVDDDGNVTVSNTVDVCAPHLVKLKSVSPFTFSDGTTEKLFNALATDASAGYTLNPVPKVGDGAYLEVYYNDNPNVVKTFSK